MKSANDMTLEELRKLLKVKEKERSKIVVKIGVLKHDLYKQDINKVSDLIEKDLCFYTKENVENSVNTFVVEIKKGSIFECKIIDVKGNEWWNVKGKKWIGYWFNEDFVKRNLEKIKDV